MKNTPRPTKDAPVSKELPPVFNQKSCGGVAADRWYLLATRAALQIRDQYGIPDRMTKQKMVRAFGAALRPRSPAGRKPSEATLKAVAMLAAGLQSISEEMAQSSSPGNSLRRQLRRLWRRIYHAAIPEFATMKVHTRQERAVILRRNVKAYLRRKRERTKRTTFELNGTEEVSQCLD